MAMTQKQINILSQRIEREFLPFVRMPSRYIGGEINQCAKDLFASDLAVALCFPDTYEVGISNTGLAILYEYINSFEQFAADRVYCPWTDAEQVLREKQIPLFTLESQAAVRDFDVIGFSLSTELCYTNVLNILDLAGLAIHSADRAEADPIVIAGGTMANCGEPVADFVDLFVLGDGEAVVADLLHLILDCKTEGLAKSDLLYRAARQFDSVYVPAFYRFKYENDKMTAFEPNREGLPTRIVNAVIADFENAPAVTRPIVPFCQAVHERINLEIMRGCPGRCRFCQASFLRRPIRYRSPDKLLKLADQAYAATGFDTIALLSLSTAEYPHLEELIEKLQGYFADKHVGISVPSLRVDQQLSILPKLVSSVRKSGLTIAVEAASEKLRKLIHKPLSNDDLFAAVTQAYRNGWQKIKLYFMVGFPGETPADIVEIVHLCKHISDLRHAVDGRPASINAAVSWLVPKPHTPFGFITQQSKDYFENARRLILDTKKSIRAGAVNFKFHRIEQSILESAIGRGDRRLGRVIESAWRNGARFDLWSECFEFEIWQKAFADNGFDLYAAAGLSFETTDVLPWEHLGGPEKAHLVRHLNDAMHSNCES